MLYKFRKKKTNNNGMEKKLLIGLSLPMDFFFLWIIYDSIFTTNHSWFYFNYESFYFSILWFSLPQSDSIKLGLNWPNLACSHWESRVRTWTLQSRGTWSIRSRGTPPFSEQKKISDFFNHVVPDRFVRSRGKPLSEQHFSEWKRLKSLSFILFWKKFRKPVDSSKR